MGLYAFSSLPITASSAIICASASVAIATKAEKLVLKGALLATSAAMFVARTYIDNFVPTSPYGIKAADSADGVPRRVLPFE